MIDDPKPAQQIDPDDMSVAQDVNGDAGAPTEPAPLEEEEAARLGDFA